MNRIAFQFVLAMLAVAIGGGPALHAADVYDAPPQPTARDVIENVCQQVLAVLRDQTLNADQKREKVRDIAYANINFDIMGRLSLGRFWREITDDQKTQYLHEFKQLITNTYGHITDNYTDEDVAILGDRQEADGDDTVNTRITGTQDGKPNQEVAKVDYRLRNQDNQWKVIDFTIDNASIVANYRAQFQEIMSNGGIDQLLKLLHDKNAANAK
ncbi:MAG: ABC transporter substrate-binding protein [Tepidisphaeraceae bacterium]|jgi:phospholipid transport system substrate-binding protein